LTPERLQQFKRMLSRLWIFSPERLWLLSIGLRERGHWILAFWCKQLNTLIYSNSLAPAASVSPDVYLGHNSIGTVVAGNVQIGSRVVLWHGVTLAAGAPPRRPAGASQASAAGGPGDGAAEASAAMPAAGAATRIVVEDGVVIGAHAQLLPLRGTLRIGRNARIGAGAVVTEDVPPGATVVSPPARIVERPAPGGTQTPPAEDLAR
jgi:serine O-acetyltransferase